MAKKIKEKVPVPTDEDFIKSLARDINDVTMTHFMENDNFLYMLYSLQQRAIPSAIDGVKPGQRRLLYSMYASKLGPNSKPFKSSRVVSDTIGKFHPHGTTAMYETLAALAADYRRVRLIDGIGDFGMNAGDTPAADRYTEARLSDAGWELVRELEYSPVEMIPTYDKGSEEPVFLPVKFPPLLIGGSHGMTDGWATETPAHNPRELMDLIIAILNNPDITVDEMLTIMPGPDWGTGGKIVNGNEGIREYFDKGRGYLTVQGTFEVTKKSVIVKSLPPGVNFGTFKSQVRKDISSGSLANGKDIRDGSDIDNGMHLEIYTRRGVDNQQFAQELLRSTALESTYAASIVALDRNLKPRWWNIKELIDEFIEFRSEIVLNRSKNELKVVEKKLAQASALASVLLDKDTVVQLIKDSEDKDQASVKVGKHFDLDTVGADYIVALPLYRLSKADTLEAQKNVQKLRQRKDALSWLINDPSMRRMEVLKEVSETRKLFDDEEYDRKTLLCFDEPSAKKERNSSSETVDSKKILSLWKLDAEMGVIGDTGSPIVEGEVIWAVYATGKVKLFDGSGLPKRKSITPISPDVSDLISCGTLIPGEKDIAIVTAKGKVLRISTDPESGKFNPQGLAGNGVAGIKLADDDNIVGGFAVTDNDCILTQSDSSWKVTDVADIPAKGRGSGGVAVHKFVKKESDILITNCTDKSHGFYYETTEKNSEGKKEQVKKKLECTPRAKATVKQPGIVINIFND